MEKCQYLDRTFYAQNQSDIASIDREHQHTIMSFTLKGIFSLRLELDCQSPHFAIVRSAVSMYVHEVVHVKNHLK